MIAGPICLTLFALYLLFAGQASRAELSAAALAAIVGSAFAVYLQRQGRRPMRLDLWRARLPAWFATAIERVTGPAFVAVDRLHTGIMGDYVAWITVRLAMFAAAVAFG